MSTNIRIKNLRETNKHECTNFFIRLFVTICKKIPSLIRPFACPVYDAPVRTLCNRLNRKELFGVVIREQPGFGLLEVLISVGILALVTGAVIGLGNISVKNSVISADRTVAYNLAQEGQEGLKQIRDSKWTDNAPNDWNSDFDTNASTSYRLNKYADTLKFNLTPGSEEIILDNITYTRSITFSAPDDIDALNKTFIENGIDNTNNEWMVKATVNVTWQEYGRDWSVELPVYFTDWLSY